MNYNKLPDSEHRWRTISLVLFSLLIVIGIIYLKHLAGEQRNLNGSSGQPAVAVPDTSVDPGQLPPIADTIITSVLPDTVLGKDKRDPFEAGYEDGYGAGCDDGALGIDQASYDETSNFSSSDEKQRYAKGYREGYTKGYEDGKNGKQFNI